MEPDDFKVGVCFLYQGNPSDVDGIIGLGTVTDVTETVKVRWEWAPHENHYAVEDSYQYVSIAMWGKYCTLLSSDKEKLAVLLKHNFG
jgi:hypothetical protein